MAEERRVFMSSNLFLSTITVAVSSLPRTLRRRGSRRSLVATDLPVAAKLVAEVLCVGFAGALAQILGTKRCAP